MSKILVIKLSAFGDFMLAMGHFQAIRKHHPDDEIVLLTTSPFAELGKRSGVFDSVMIDARPKWYQISKWKELRDHLLHGGFDRVYDLQMNDRSAMYYRLLWDIPYMFKGPVPEWAGVSKGCTFYTPDERGKDIHAYERGSRVLKSAGISKIDLPDISWMGSDVSTFDLPDQYGLLVIGAAPAHPLKRWSEKSYAQLAQKMVGAGITPVLIGSGAEKELAKTIEGICPAVKNFVCKTDFDDLVELGRGALFCVGNDTGPTHIISLSGCPTLALFSGQTNPIQSAPIGKRVEILQKDKLDDLSVDEVWHLTEAFLT